MRWSELDLKGRIWTIPANRAKNGHAHEVPLSDAALKILRGVPRFLHSDFVFTTNGRRYPRRAAPPRDQKPVKWPKEALNLRSYAPNHAPPPQRAFVAGAPLVSRSYFLVALPSRFPAPWPLLHSRPDAFVF